MRSDSIPAPPSGGEPPVRSARRRQEVSVCASELGVGLLRVCAAVWLAAAPPALVAWLVSVDTAAALEIAAAALIAALAAVAAGLALLRRRIVAPALSALDVVDALRLGDRASPVPEAGAPLLQRLVASVNAACSAVDRRSRLSQANLLSAETAFERIHAVLQSLMEGVILIDQNARVVLANSCARRLLASDVGPIEGRPFADVGGPVLSEAVQRALQQLEQERGEHVEIHGLEVSKRVLDISVVRAQSLRQGDPFGSVVALVDVTSKYEVARLKDEFLSSVSHELRTPLTNICAFAELLGDVTPDNDKDWREFLSIVTAESERLRCLVDDVLELNRLQTAQQPLDVMPFDAAEVARAAVELCADRARSLGIGIEAHAPAGAVLALGDAGKLRQVLARLLDNALKFTPRGGRVRVSAATGDGTVEIRVSDSGRGIATEHREVVFERFRQIGDHMTEKPSGAGLGLPICRSIIERLGGSICCADSELGGAELRCVLPASRAQSGAAPAAGAEHAGGAAADGP